MYYVIVINGLGSLIVAFLLVATLRRPRKAATDYALIAILAGDLGWLLSDGLGFILAVRFGYISAIHGGITGNMILLQVFAIYVFCEMYPRPPLLRGYWIRIGLAFSAMAPLSYMVFTPYWIINRRVVDGFKAGDPGPLFALLPVWAILVICAGVFVLFLRVQSADRRSKRNAYIFSVAVLVNLCLALLVSFILVYFGVYTLNFLGPVTCVVLVASTLYGISFHRLTNIKAVAIRYLIHVFVGAAIGMSVFVFARTMLNGMIATILAFFLGIAYYRLLRPRIEVMLRSQRTEPSSIVVELLSGRLFDVRHLSQELLLSELVRVAVLKLKMKGGTIIALDATGGTLIRSNGSVQAPSPESVRTLLRLEGRRLPPFVLDEIDSVHLFETGSEETTNVNRSGLEKRYPHTARALRRELLHLERQGYILMAPLVSNREIVGYLLLTQPTSGGIVYQEDLELLDAIRAAAGVLLRNWRYYAEIGRRSAQAEAEVAKLSGVIAKRNPIRHPIGDRFLVYGSVEMEKVLKECALTAKARSQSVLVLGETGTGKELIAKNIHQLVTPDEPFIAVNCAAIPETLWEADLFGHMRGSFTDARQDQKGKILLAQKGTLFFDEIGEMPIAMQAKMLRLLQERVYYPIGSPRSLTAECRFIFATNCDLEAMVAAGKFRQDLYYRINVFPLQIPPLRSRPDDILPIAAYLMERLHEEVEERPGTIDPAAVHLLLDYEWPGNARELENVLTRASTLAEGVVLTEEDLPETIRGRVNGHRGNAPTAIPAEPEHLSGNYKILVKEYRRSLVQAALRRAKGNKTRAAELLGVKRTTLNGQISELGIRT